MTETRPEVSNRQVGEDYNLFDKDNFVSNSPLSGKRGTILPGTKFVRRPSFKGSSELTTTLIFHVASEAFAKFGGIKTYYVKCGRVMPAILEGGQLVPKEQGPLLAGTVDKKSAFRMFRDAVSNSGFPTANMAGKVGVTALDGAEFTWKCITKDYKGDIGEKDYDLPAEFHGFADLATLPTVQADEDFTFPADAPAAAATGNGNGHATDPEVIAEAVKTIQAIVAQHGETARGQMGIKSAVLLRDNPKRVAIQAAMLKDATYEQVPGITFDAKTVRPAAQQ